jgi:hypothetical protein
MPVRQPPLRLELCADEPDRRDTVLLRRAQETEPRPVARRLVLEDDLIEARERVPNMRRVVDGSRRLPLESMYANALSGSCARVFASSFAMHR